MRLIHNPDFVNVIKTHRKVYGVRKDGFKTVKEKNDWEKTVKHKNYLRQLKTIRVNCKGLTNRDDHLLQHYFYYNNINPVPTQTDGATTHIKVDLSHKFVEEKYTIEVFPDTTEAQVKKALSELKRQMKVRGVKTSAYSPNDYLERDLRMLELDRDEYLPERILKVINKEYPHQQIDKGADSIDYLKDRIRKIEKQVTNSYKTP